MNQVSFDPEFTQGAANAVQVCLRVQPDEKVCVITDEVTLEIAAAIVREIEAVGAGRLRQLRAGDARQQQREARRCSADVTDVHRDATRVK